MTDKKNISPFPQSEMPPHPQNAPSQGNLGQNVASMPSPIDALTPQAQEEIKNETLSQVVEPPHQEIKSMPSKFGSKKLLIYLALFLVVVVAILIGLRIFASKGRTCGTKGEIVWWGVQHEEAVFAPLIEEYESQNPGVDIIYKKQSPQDYRERLVSDLANCTGPAIFEMHNSWPGMFDDELSILPSSVMSKEEFSAAFYPAIVANLTLSKGIIGIPLEFDALTLFINEDIFASAVKSPPLTWDDLRILVDPEKEGSLTVKTDRRIIVQSGVALGETVNVDYWPEILALMMFQNKVNPAKPNTSQAGDVFSFYTLFKRNGVWDDTLPSSTSAFARGILAMYFAPTRSTTDIVKNNPNFRFRTIPLPQLPKSSPTDPNFSYATYWVQGVWDNSVNKEEAWKFLKYISGNDALQRINANIKEFESVERAYPRSDMNIEFRDDPILASVVSMALDAKTWYLADNTNDGQMGINSQLEEIFGKTLNEWRGSTNQRVLDGMAEEVKTILSSFGI